MTSDLPHSGHSAPETGFQPDPAAEAFYNGAEARALRFLLAISVVTALGLLAYYGSMVALGFVLGAAAAAVNLFWLKRFVAGVTAAIVKDARRPSSVGMVFRYLVRFALITFAAFAIFKSSRTSGYGFLAGLFMPVAALMCAVKLGRMSKSTVALPSVLRENPSSLTCSAMATGLSTGTAPVPIS